MSIYWEDGTSNFKSDLPTRKRTKGQKARAEAKVKQRVRAECEARDGYCLVLTRLQMAGCKGRSTWAHFAGHRRSQTRGMAPELRHDARFSGMLCERHHSLEERGLYQVAYRTSEFANGPVSWVARKQKAA